MFYNNQDDGDSWNQNPAGIAVRIKKPDSSVLWTTRSYYGEDGHNRPFGDGGGSGGGGGNGGPAGLTSVEMGFSGGSCSNEDSTGQGGSAGASWILDHPSVSLTSFRQAPSGFIAGWMTPTPPDASVRSGGGGWGPIVTPTLISTTATEPRKVIGTVSAAEFVVAVAASIGFLAQIGRIDINWAIVGGLAIGGTIAAPFAAKLVGILPAKQLGIVVAVAIIALNAVTIIRA